MTGGGDGCLDCLYDCGGGHSIRDAVTLQRCGLISFAGLKILNVLCMACDRVSQTGYGAGVRRVPFQRSTSRVDAGLLTSGGGIESFQRDLTINNFDGLVIAQHNGTDGLQRLIRLDDIQVCGRVSHNANILTIKINAVRTTNFNSGGGGSLSGAQGRKVIPCVQRERSLRIK